MLAAVEGSKQWSKQMLMNDRAGGRLAFLRCTRIAAIGILGGCFGLVAITAIGPNLEGWIVAFLGSFCIGWLSPDFEVRGERRDG